MIHSGLHTHQVQALSVATCTRPQQADQFGKHINSIPISIQSLLGEALRSTVAKEASTARDYAAIADSFSQAGLQKPIPPWGGTATKGNMNDPL